MLYESIFLDVDGTLLWLDLDLNGYVEDLAGYANDGQLTVERASGPVHEAMREYIAQHVKYRTLEALNGYKLESAAKTSRKLGLEVPPDLLLEVTERRLSFNLFPEAESVVKELKQMGLRLYVVSNWDILLQSVLEDLGLVQYFEAIIVSSVVGVEKPDAGIFEVAIKTSGSPRSSIMHVGNDPIADIQGASRSGLDAVLVERKGDLKAPEAKAVIPDLSYLPQLLRS